MHVRNFHFDVYEEILNARNTCLKVHHLQVLVAFAGRMSGNNNVLFAYYNLLLYFVLEWLLYTRQRNKIFLFF